MSKLKMFEHMGKGHRKSKRHGGKRKSHRRHGRR